MPSFDSYAALRNHQTTTSDILEWHFTSLVKSMYRKVSLHQRYRNPWRICVAEKIKFEIFIQFYKAVRDFKISYGRTLKLEKYKNSSIKVITITFTHLGALKYHLTQTTNGNLNDINEFFEKKLKNGNKGAIIVTEEKPATLTHKVATSTLTMDLCYKVYNKYGNICSF